MSGLQAIQRVYIKQSFILSESERLVLKAENELLKQRFLLETQRYEQITRCVLGYIGYESLKNTLSN